MKNQMIQFLKQLSGGVNPRLFTSLNQNNAGQIAFMRQMERELREKDVLEVPFQQLKVVVFDLETTGFYPNKGDRILSIGAVKMQGEQLLETETFYSLVHSDQGPPEEIERLTGITREQLERANRIEQVLKEFYQFIKSDPLVAHHANHEKTFMHHATWATLRSSFNHRIIDTSFLTKIVQPEINLVTLDECCTHYGIEVNQRHHALGDAIITAKLWAENVRAIQELGFCHLRDVYAYLAKK